MVSLDSKISSQIEHVTKLQKGIQFEIKTSNQVLNLAGPRLVGAPLHRCALMEKNVKVPSGLS